MNFRNAALIIIFLFCQSCNIESEKKTQNSTNEHHFTEATDTSALWDLHVIKIDSLGIDTYKRFVRERVENFEDENYSFIEIDSVYNNMLGQVDVFTKIQDFVSIDVKKNESYRSEYLIQITNKSEYLIDAFIIDFEYYDMYKDYIGRGELEIIVDMPPGATHTQRFTPLYRSNRVIYNDYRSFYGSSAVKKISFSKNESLESRLTGTVYKTSLNALPKFLELGLGRNIHLFRI